VGLTTVRDDRKLAVAAPVKGIGGEGKDTRDNLAKSDYVGSNVADIHQNATDTDKGKRGSRAI
jgi:hypothetical protein